MIYQMKSSHYCEKNELYYFYQTFETNKIQGLLLLQRFTVYFQIVRLLLVITILQTSYYLYSAFYLVNVKRSED
jgi:hypothetical protein